MRLSQLLSEASDKAIIDKVAKTVGISKNRAGLFQLYTHQTSTQVPAVAVRKIIQKTWTIYADRRFPLTPEIQDKIVEKAWNLT